MMAADKDSRANEGKSGSATHNFPATAYEYAKMVEPELGVPPRVDLGKGVEIPLYADGVQTYGTFDNKEIDNPTRLGGKTTVSGSVLQRYEGRTADGKRLPDVVWVAFARNASYDKGGTLHVFGSVQMIGYDKETGATAFFESSDRIDPWVDLQPKTLRMTGVLPWIDDPKAFNRAFVTPGAVQCVACHQNDPFIHSDFIDAAKMPGTDEPVVPVIAERSRTMEFDLPYYVIGGENWDMRTIHIEGNKCLNCHRMGIGTLKLFVQAGWDPNAHMPPNNPGSLSKHLEELLDAWENTPEKTPGAEWVVPPTEDDLGRVVGDDYPHKAQFNSPGHEALGTIRGKGSKR
jgi:hypothetical protein